MRWLIPFFLFACFSTSAQATIAPLEAGDGVYVNQLSYYPKVSAGGASASVSLYQGGGATGTIIGGPTTISEIKWFNVDFATGVDGWVQETGTEGDVLRRISDAGAYYATPTVLRPGLTLNAYPYSVQPGGTATLQWESFNTTSCTTSWGSTATNGTFVTPPLYATTTYTIYCTDGTQNTATKTAHIGMGYATPKVAAVNYGAVHSSVATQDSLVKFNLVITGNYYGSLSLIQNAVSSMKSRNPNMKIGKYIIASELTSTGNNNYNPSINIESDTNGWWLRTAAGALTTWTTDYSTWIMNMTSWAGNNEWGDSFATLSGKVHARDFFNKVPDYDYVMMDDFYSDSINGQQIPANWKKDGVDRTILSATVDSVAYPGDAEIGVEYRENNIDFINTLKYENPGIQVMGNGGDGAVFSADLGGLAYPEYAYQMEGNVMECVIGKSYSRETWRSTAADPINVGWNENMERYRKAMRYTKVPHDVLFHVCRGADPTKPETMTPERDMMRYGLASAMLDDGWFVYHPGLYTAPLSSWYDEYDAPMGKPTEAPPTTPTFNGVYTRTYENGMVVVNPRKDISVTIAIPAGYKRLLGTEDPTINTGQPVTSLTMAPRSGILLIRDSTSDIAPTDTSSDSDGKKKKNKKNKPNPSISDSATVVRRGETLIQSGKNFPKNRVLALSFARPNGTYYPPVMIRTSSKGGFSTRYRVTKPAGTYQWYAVDTISGKKTKVRSYVVR